MRFHVVRPVELAGTGVEAIHEAGQVADEHEAGVRVNRNRRDTAVDLIVAPDLAGRRDVAGPGGVDAGQYADAFAVLGVLAHGDVNAIFVKHRRRVDFADAFSRRVFEFLTLRRIAIVFPGNLEIGRV